MFIFGIVLLFLLLLIMLTPFIWIMSLGPDLPDYDEMHDDVDFL